MSREQNETTVRKSTVLLANEIFGPENMLGTAHLIAAALRPIADTGSHIDSGCGQHSADLWVKIGGVEYHLAIRKSNAQIQKEGGER